MRFQQRVFVLAGIALSALAACSGSFGSGSGLPQTLASPGFGNATPSPVPDSSSVILTVGESTAFQSLPEIGGYSGAIAFPKVAPDPVKSPSASAKNASAAPAPTPVSIAVGASLSVKKPNDGPDLNLESGKGKKKRSREHPARALAYVTLLPTHDVTLESYPRFALDVPRDIATQYRDGEFGLALWNAGEKDESYRLAVAELDRSSTPPPAAARSAAAANVAPNVAASDAATAVPSTGTRSSGPTGMGGNVPFSGQSMSPLGGASRVPAATAAPTLPPQRILFASSEKTLKLIANRPAVFALYALPHPVSGGTAAPAAVSVQPSAAASAAASATPAPSTSPSRQ
ncbi:hypothetical protein WPS_04710 [Vulcanimicrobium alpinum]|uniref:Uncharacterized protein n=1 Tax=Vulcanimicrobium alpinum TaxID=3016050 RepID=A0AAN1XSX7_UNVUL|nr:hypothetical protein [Vulcanimicrobium alpinum]BDE05195.1 hypothetical protein WPS_04710 [Vulcanimicrobium alpinum]